MRRSPWIVPIALAALVAAGAIVRLARGPLPERAGIAVIVLDTVRPDHLPPWGAPAENGPWMAGLGARSAVFESAISTSSWTAPSTASVFTGLYPIHHGVTEGFRAQQRRAGDDRRADEPSIALRGMPAGVPTLPERLRAAGWQTVGVASNINIGAHLGFDRGFETFHSESEATADALARRAVRAVAVRDERPVFLYVHLNDAHHPYDARAPYYRPAAPGHADDAARYDSEIRYMDDALARTAARLGWDERWTVLLLSDHGEAFGEHGHRGHVFSLHGEVSRVAMAISGPGVPRGLRIREPTSLVDVLPTVLELAGAEAAPGDGRSLVPLLRGEAADLAERTLFGHRTAPNRETTLWSAQRGPWKLIEEPGAPAPHRLYDVASDPGELVDRSATEPAVRDALAAGLAAFRAGAAAPSGPGVEIDVDPGLYRELEALGYVDP